MNKLTMTRLTRFAYCLVALVLMAVVLWPTSALACACCSVPGTWYERIDSLGTYQLAEIDRLRFDATANIYMTEAGEDTIQGISNPADGYTLSLVKRQRRWELRFRDKQGRTGTLAFNVPPSLTEFAADINDGQESAGGGPLLYKEWRLTGPVTGTGVFKKGSTAQTKFRLILQGRGNGCTDAAVFDNWKLQVFGPRASYAFSGKLKDPA